MIALFLTRMQAQLCRRYMHGHTSGRGRVYSLPARDCVAASKCLCQTINSIIRFMTEYALCARIQRFCGTTADIRIDTGTWLRWDAATYTKACCQIYGARYFPRMMLRILPMPLSICAARNVFTPPPASRFSTQISRRRSRRNLH